MNVFHIPSWYPSENNPIYGTFIKEQIEILARENREWNHGISTWGQGDPDHMLWLKDPINNYQKIFTARAFHSEQTKNLYWYHQPSLTWTRRILNGNLDRLVEINEEHFRFFQDQVGQVNIIHAQATYPGALVAHHLSKIFEVEYFVSIRMSPFPFEEFLALHGKLKPWVSKPLTEAKGLIAPSHFLKKRLEAFGFRQVHVIPNPVDTTFFKPLKKHEVEKITALTVGRMVPQKGIDLLIQAINTLGKNSPIDFRIAGDGPDLPAYKQLAKDLGVEDKITWLGQLSREEVRDEMQKCSFYILPSRHETFGNVLLEAMACGKPVVATRCGGPEDIVTKEVGMLCKPDSSEKLTESILKMSECKNQYSQKSILNSVGKKFSPLAFFTSYSDLTKN